KKSKRKVTADVFPFHSWAFQEGLLHAENLGGDIELMLNKRALIGAFPWRYEGLESCPCRIVAFLDAGDDVEAVGNPAKAIIGGGGTSMHDISATALASTQVSSPRKRGPSNHCTFSDYWVPALAPLRFARPGRQPLENRHAQNFRC